ncbi:MAG: hypothetical protein HYY35_07315 [Deltaproteobacteria bacterium]|nr:hypothetical protein [Deltaproteobacteria bacterium]
MMDERSASARAGAGLKVLGGLTIVLVLAAALFAVVIGLVNLPRIGV